MMPLDLSLASVQCEAQSNDEDIAHLCNSALKCIREIKREASDSFAHWKGGWSAWCSHPKHIHISLFQDLLMIQDNELCQNAALWAYPLYNMAVLVVCSYILKCGVFCTHSCEAVASGLSLILAVFTNVSQFSIQPCLCSVFDNNNQNNNLNHWALVSHIFTIQANFKLSKGFCHQLDTHAMGGGNNQCKYSITQVRNLSIRYNLTIYRFSQ